MPRSKGTRLPGDPDGPEWLPVTTPLVPDWEMLAPKLRAVLERGWLTNQGESARELERQLQHRFGVAHALLMTNGTLALEVLIRSVFAEGEVIVPAFSFPATWNLLLDDPRYTIRFVDVLPNGTLDPRCVEQSIGPNTVGILGVHAYGYPCDHERLSALADRHSLTLIYDAAHAFDVRWNQRSLASLGTASAWSFHATKVFNTLEGGAVTTNDAALAEQLHRRRNFGFGAGGQTLLGTNAKMDEFRAVFGLATLPQVQAAISSRGHIARRYDEALASIDGISTPKWLRQTDCFQPNYAYYPVFFSSPEARARAEQALRSRHVLPRRYFGHGLFEHPVYRERVHAADYPVAARLTETVLCLPIHHKMTNDDADFVIDILRTAERT